ncbi:MAG: LacI family transcriptional regulator [Bacteroidetes bacterium HGW-Bacteroidetes-16]|nr:MAG: LacI family transcriptional regulator [Bacteroidetes bacterium HGW-Bacteroidetes-16]
MKKKSLSDIARSLNVSKTLVSFVLNDQGDKNGISSKTQKIVLERAREMNYKPNHMARGLRLGKTQTLGLIVADISNTFYAKMAKKIEEVANQHHYNLIFCSSDENPEKEIELINMLKERQVDGIIISTTQKNGAVFSWLKKENYPFVLIDRKLPKLTSNFAGVDNFTGAYEATEQLIKNGYRKIGLLKISPTYLSTIADRERGYRSALKNNGIRANNKLIRTINCSDIRQQVRAVLSELLEPPYKIDALFSVNNNITVACMEYLNEMNINIPLDVAMVSFDDIDLFRLSCPTITAVAQPVEEIGECAVNILLDEINGLTTDKKQVLLPVKLIKRRSCGRGV